MLLRTTRILRNSIRALGRNRLRTFFMTFAAFAGVCALTVILALGRGTQRDVMRRVDRMLGGSTILLRAGGGQSRGGPHGGGPVTTLTIDDMRAIERGISDVELIDPMLTTVREVTAGAQTRRTRVEGHSEAAEIVWTRPVTRGAWFTAADVASSARVALVGEVAARELFAGTDPIGQQIRIGAVPFQVTGVLARAGADPHGIDLDDIVMIPITTMQRRVANVDYIVNAKLGLTGGVDVERAADEVRGILRAQHGLGPGQPDDFGIFTPIQVQHMVRSTSRVFTVFLPLVALGVILIGGLVIANLMLMTVNDRRAEIGLRRTVGARSRDIRLQFFAESAAVAGLGGLAAVLVGYVIVQFIAMHGTGPARMPWDAALLGLAAAVVVGIVSGIAPARRAARLDPVQTLR